MSGSSEPLGDHEGLPPLLSTDDLSTLLRIDRRSASRLLRSGRLPACKIGRRWFCRRSSFLEHVMALERKAARGMS